MAPASIKSQRDALRMNDTTFIGKGYWMHVGHDGAVYFNKQRNGERAVASVMIPRATFARMIEWYFKEQDAEPTRP